MPNDARALFKLQRKKLLTPISIGLYFYFAEGKKDERYTMKQIVQDTGYSDRAVRYNMPVLRLCGLVEIYGREPTLYGGGFHILLRSPISPEVRKATSKRGTLGQIQKYRAWQYKERNHIHKEREKNGT